MSDPAEPPAGRRPRAERRDSVRNRSLLVDAARRAFATDGLDASLDGIASSAGVGAGTLYRHFPARVDLWQAVLVEPLTEHLHLVESALATPDAWQGFASYVESSCALEAEGQGYLNLMTTHYAGSEELLGLRSRIQDLVHRLVDRAVAEGAVRPDLVPEDLLFVMLSNARVAEATRDVAPTAWRRNVGLLLDALRHDRATPLSEPPMTPRQVLRTLMRPRARSRTRAPRGSDGD